MELKAVGMRNIKTAIAVSICVALSYILNREYIFYAAIASVISMQGSVYDSFKAGKNRMLGTMVGAFVGFLFALVSPGNIFLCGLGVVIVIYICNMLGWKNSVAISCIVFLVIMLNLEDRTPGAYSLNRIFDTFIGIIVAVMVNYFIYPPKHANKVYNASIVVVDKIYEIIKDKVCFNRNINLESLNKELLGFENKLNTYLAEFRVNKKDGLKVDRVREILYVCKEIYAHLKIIQSLELQYSLNKENCERMIQLFNCELNYIENKNDVSIVYNYHVDKVLDNLYKLKMLKEN
ncbi:aromatic acid exporter family protein [Clostridium sp. DJ247]|nr:aromatic acid exporter family protein [Clostridium sp. DJ247]